MTQEQKEKLEQKAEKRAIDSGCNPLHTHPDLKFSEENIYTLIESVYKEAAQTILENPQEWGFVDVKEHNDYLGRYARAIDKIANLESQLAKYREALERFATMTQNDVSGHYVSGTEKYPVEEAARVVKNFMDLVNHIAKEALKNEQGS